MFPLRSPDLPIVSLIPQRHHGIDLRRPAGGEYTRDCCHTGQHEQRDRKRSRISGRQPEQQALDEFRARQCKGRPYHHADNNEPQCLLEKEPNDLDPPRTERHPDTNFLSAPRDRVGGDTVKADTAQSKSKRTEQQ